METQIITSNIPTWLVEELKYVRYMHRHHWRHQDYYQKNKERLKKQAKEYRLNNPEKTKESIRKYRLKNLDNIKKQQIEYYYKNREIKLLKRKEYREKYPEKVSLTKKKSFKKNIEKRYLYRKQYFILNPSQRIALRLRLLLNSALKRYTKNGKIMSSRKYGIDYKKIINHLQPFPANIQDYHIDHIKPLCSFNLNNPEQVKEAFSPSNHRWLLKEENLRKASKDKLSKINF